MNFANLPLKKGDTDKLSQIVEKLFDKDAEAYRKKRDKTRFGHARKER